MIDTPSRTNRTALPRARRETGDGRGQNRGPNQAPSQGPSQGQGAERRQASRYDCEGYAEVFLPLGGLRFRGRILNLSLTGCFIEANFNLERGTRVEIYFEARHLRFRVAGAVAALRNRRGVGVSFVDLTPRRAAQIEDLVQELKEELEEGLEVHS
ncbi:PilZ domain-containing protein [Paracidobacterium acidisoli]|uniref:PilZ domain-containing protein n=1 Tax=Paracidobacterium acidisoli TaxID=2303751 RepID=A0A372IPY9_9BACT|nr:PilZ domain-containing protein [Paracidobacterium acidisoli]MBT9331312.1 PilZ domain-containing protein [Paracidobacterium acidisoli]